MQARARSKCCVPFQPGAQPLTCAVFAHVAGTIEVPHPPHAGDLAYAVAPAMCVGGRMAKGALDGEQSGPKDVGRPQDDPAVKEVEQSRPDVRQLERPVCVCGLGWWGCAQACGVQIRRAHAGSRVLHRPMLGYALKGEHGIQSSMHCVAAADRTWR